MVAVQVGSRGSDFVGVGECSPGGVLRGVGYGVEGGELVGLLVGSYAVSVVEFGDFRVVIDPFGVGVFLFPGHPVAGSGESGAHGVSVGA